MPRRIRNVRCSVRKLTQTQDPDTGIYSDSYAHVRYQRFSLYPLSGEQVFRISRGGYDANWAAVARSRPEIKDGWRLVHLNADGDPDLVLEVRKVTPRGRRAHLLLEEKGPVQS